MLIINVFFPRISFFYNNLYIIVFLTYTYSIILSN